MNFKEMKNEQTCIDLFSSDIDSDGPGSYAEGATRSGN